jgi:hypothetical protein
MRKRKKKTIFFYFVLQQGNNDTSKHLYTLLIFLNKSNSAITKLLFEEKNYLLEIIYHKLTLLYCTLVYNATSS